MRLFQDLSREGAAGGYQHQAGVAEQEKERARVAMSRLVRMELDILAAADLGIPLDLDKAEAERAGIEKRVGTETYGKLLADFGWTPEIHRRHLAEEAAAKVVREKHLAARWKVTPEEARREYDGDKAKWGEPAAIRVQEILFAVPSGSPAETWESRRADAAKTAEEIAAGADFGTLAAARSDDDYRIRGGDLGWVPRGKLLPELEAALWEAPAGRLVGPVRSTAGWHLARVLERRSAVERPYAEVEGKVTFDLQARKRQEAERSWYRDLSAKHPVSILVPGLEGLSF